MRISQEDGPPPMRATSAGDVSRALAVSLVDDTAAVPLGELEDFDRAVQLSLADNQASQQFTDEMRVASHHVKYIIGTHGSTRKDLEAKAGGNTRISVRPAADEPPKPDGSTVSVVQINSDDQAALDTALGLIVAQLWRCIAPKSKRTILIPTASFGAPPFPVPPFLVPSAPAMTDCHGRRISLQVRLWARNSAMCWQSSGRSIRKSKLLHLRTVSTARRLLNSRGKPRVS